MTQEYSMLPGETVKKCFKCGGIFSLNFFYSHSQMKDGHLNKCKACTKKDNKANYRDNIVHYKKYDRARNQERREYNLDRSRSWALKNKEKIGKIKKEWETKNSEKRKAHNVLNNAIRDGKKTKTTCIVCGSVNVEAHHTDYTRPLEVAWLCEQHHKDVHRLYKQAQDFAMFKTKMIANTNKAQKPSRGNARDDRRKMAGNDNSFERQMMKIMAVN